VSTTIARVGELRPSQLLYTFGVGAAVDLPHLSAIVLGLDDWDPSHSEVVTELRLLGAVRSALGKQVLALRLPPFVETTGNPLEEWARIGVPVAPFPRWLRCPRCSYLGPISSGVFQLKTNPYRPDQARYVHTCATKGRPPDVLPARFLIACSAGHLDDFPWVQYVHRGHPCSAPILELYERGVTGRAAEVMVKCRSCDVPDRSMADAFGENAQKILPKCRGRHPHLKSFGHGCDQPVRTILLGASNAWFPVTLSALSIPHSADPVAQKVSELWQHLLGVTSLEVLRYAKANVPALRPLAGVDDGKLMQAIDEYRKRVEAGVPETVDLLAAEWDVLSSPEHAPASDDFRLRSAGMPDALRGRVEQVVLADRLREVVALIGFTRVAPPDEVEAGEGSPRAPLSRGQVAWVPCAEVNGEGVFIRLPEEQVAAWEQRVAGHPQIEHLMEAHRTWRQRWGLDPDEGWPGARYVLLHTLAHVLIREFALECGYGAASIKERLYARGGPEPMAGVLLYTAASDSEGTLGGLVSLGKPENLGRLLRDALEHARLCTSDPLCSEHDPTRDGSLHGAACHACAFASETSCERGNRYLDRALLVETFAASGLGYFSA
jgi:MrfA Zn-binding domain